MNSLTKNFTGLLDLQDKYRTRQYPKARLLKVQLLIGHFERFEHFERIEHFERFEHFQRFCLKTSEI